MLSIQTEANWANNAYIEQFLPILGNNCLVAVPGKSQMSKIAIIRYIMTMEPGIKAGLNAKCLPLIFRN